MTDLLVRVGTLGRSPIGGSLPNNSYSTTFPFTQNPVSDSGAWLAWGLTTGLDWHDVRTSPGLAYGTMTESDPNFTDSLAILAGTWSDDQTLIATVKNANPQVGSIFEEIELLCRFSISAHAAAGYEFLFAARPSSDPGRYIQIVRWNGALGDFTVLNGGTGPGISDGDRIKATCIGNPFPVLRIYRAPAADPTNFTEIFNYDTATGGDGNGGGPDTVVHHSGRPGIAFYGQGVPAANITDYGMTAFSAAAA